MHVVKPDGHGLEVQLLRPIDWLAETGAAAGGTIRLQIDELGIDGPATVLSIDDCPAIRPGPGHVVTGTFAHDPSDNLINVQVEGEPEPIGHDGRTYRRRSSIVSPCSPKSERSSTDRCVAFKIGVSFGTACDRNSYHSFGFNAVSEKRSERTAWRFMHICSATSYHDEP